MTGHAITHVSDTALWVATYRAMESERSDAIFRDPYARRLAGEKGEQIVASLKRGRQMAWPMIVRTAVIDEMVTRLVADGVDTVVNLAAGLDTRPWRMDIPDTLRWFEVDLPGMVAYKREQMASIAPRCQLEMIEADLGDPGARGAALATAMTGADCGLVISEGLLVYLPPTKVVELARALHGYPPLRWWITDIASPKIIKMMERRWGKDMWAGNSPFLFAPEEGTAFFSPHGWREAEFRSMWVEARRLKRTMPLAWLWAFVGRLAPKKSQERMRRMAGFVLLERSQVDGTRRPAS